MEKASNRSSQTAIPDPNAEQVSHEALDTDPSYGCTMRSKEYSSLAMSCDRAVVRCVPMRAVHYFVTGVTDAPGVPRVSNPARAFLAASTVALSPGYQYSR